MVECLVHGQKGRAWVAILLPIAALSLILYQLFIHGYGIFDIYYLIQTGELTIGRQLALASALTLWILIFYPPAIFVLKNKECILESYNGNISLSETKICNLKDIKSVESKNGILKKGVIISTDSSRHYINTLFASEKNDEIIAALFKLKSEEGSRSK
jgi:hypothetical protein